MKLRLRAEHRAADELNGRHPTDTREATIDQLDELGTLLACLRDQLRQREDLGAWQLSRLLVVLVDSQASIETACQLAGLEVTP